MEDIQSVLHNNGIIIYPTDTAFGIGCRIDRPKAVDRLFALRKRPAAMAMPMLVDSIDMALSYLLSPSLIVRRLMEQHWPGALTIVSFCKQERIYSPIRAAGLTIGVRMPDNETITKIIHDAGVPILGSSANFHGDPTPFSVDDLNPQLTKLVDMVVPGVCNTKVASTVVDCTVDPYVIIRQGSVVL